MFIYHDRYELNLSFIGFVWKGVAIVGVDVDYDAWGITVGKYYAGWKYQNV